MNVVSAVLACVGVLVAVVASLAAAAVASEDLVRLHYLTLITAVAGPLVAAGLVVANGLTLTSGMLVLTALLLAVTGPPLTASTGRFLARYGEHE